MHQRLAAVAAEWYVLGYASKSAQGGAGGGGDLVLGGSGHNGQHGVGQNIVCHHGGEGCYG